MMAVEDGRVVLDMGAPGFIPSQRVVVTPRHAVTWAGTVALAVEDTRSTRLELGADSSPQLHTASTLVDSNGSRTVRVALPAGIMATVRDDGEERPLSALTLRATELTVGARGPAAMIGTLPSNTAYTFAVEITADEIDAMTASIALSDVASIFVDNFLGFEVGTVVPVGSYDRSRGRWVAERNGLVIRVIGARDGRAVVDTDGDGREDRFPRDIARALAGIASGAELMWAETDHFSVFDLNFPASLPPDARPPSDGTERGGRGCQRAGSIIEVEPQVLGESIPLLGTGVTLEYRSNRAPGYLPATALEVDADSTRYPDVQEVVVEIDVLGQHHELRTTPAPGRVLRWTWDGRDALGRSASATAQANVLVRHRYEAFYAEATGAPAWARAGGRFTSSISREGAWAETRFTRRVGVAVPGQGLAGWTANVVHELDRTGRVIWTGDGRAIDLNRLDADLAVWIDPGTSRAVLGGELLVEPGGSTLVAAPDSELLRVTPAGEVAVIGGRAGVFAGSSGDGGPLSAARFRGLSALARAPDGVLYLADGGTCVRRVNVGGIVSTVAGVCDGRFGDAGDGGPATSATFASISSLAIDGDGSLLVADRIARRIRRVRLDADRIEAVAGGGAEPDATDPGRLSFETVDDLLVTPDGDVIAAVGDGLVALRRDDAGVLRAIRMAGDPDGPAATRDAPAGHVRLTGVYAVARDPNGDLCFPAQAWDDVVVWCVDRARGRLREVAGGGTVSVLQLIETRRPARARSVALSPISSLAFGSDGGLLASVGSTLLRSAPLTPRIGPPDSRVTVVPDPAGGTLWAFDEDGRHLETRDLWTGSILLTFSWTPNGLERIVDGDGLSLEIERSGGRLAAVAPPHGPRSTFVIDDAGYLGAVEDVLGNRYQLTHDPDGLLRRYVEPDGAESRFDYEGGKLRRDAGPSGAATSLVQVESLDRNAVTVEGPRPGQAEDYIRSSTDDEAASSVRDDSGASAASHLGSDGTESIALSDGTRIVRHMASDPRFGGFMPYVDVATMTLPSGHAATMTQLVEVAASNGGFETPPSSRRLQFGGTSLGEVWEPSTRTRTLSIAGELFASIVLDERGRTTSVARPGLATTTYEYGSDGALVRIAHTFGGESRELQFEHDDGRLSAIVGPDAATSVVRRDAAGRIVGLAMPDGAEISMRRDPIDRVVGVTPPGASEHVLGYTSTGALRSFALPGGPTLEHELDEGSSVTATRLGGRQMSIARTPGGAIDSVTLARGTHRVVRDAEGRITSVVGPGPTPTRIGLEYDGPFVRGLTYSGLVSARVRFEPDDALSIGAWETAGTRIEIRRDGRRRVSALGALSLTYSATTGLPSRAEIGSVSTTYSTDGFAEIDRRTTRHGSVILFDEEVRARDGAGRVRHERITQLGMTHERSYTYDAVGRLERVDQDGALLESYTTTANGSRTAVQRARSSESVETGPAEQVLRAGDYMFEHLADGSRSARLGPMGRRTYDIDEVGTLLGATLEDGRSIRYDLDPLGRRIGVRHDGLLVRGFYYVDSFLPIAELDASGAVVSLFVHAPHELGPAYMERGGERYVFVKDARGSVRLVVRERDGAVVQELDYDTWGRVLRDTRPGFQPFGFASGLYDADTGLVRFGAREYDADTGTFLSPDPALLDGGLNPYAYAHGDPVQFVDPDGENPIMMIVMVGVESAVMGYFMRSWSRDAVDAQLQGCWRGVNAREIATDFAMGAATAGLGVYLSGGFSRAASLEARVAGSGLRGCFAAGTLVETEDGPMPIESLARGDRVRALDPQTGASSFEPVIRTSARRVSAALELEVEHDGRVEVLTTTPEHPFFVRNRGFVPAGSLRPGDEVFTSRGGWARVSNGIWVEGDRVVYNLEVQSAHTYFVGAVGAWVHNGGCPQWPRHHVFPQQHADYFARVGIRVDDFTVEIPRNIHVALHSGSGAGRGGLYNRIWRDWIRDNPRATREQVARFGEVMFDQFLRGSSRWMGPY
jgi:RHS repeat-associated protein